MISPPSRVDSLLAAPNPHCSHAMGWGCQGASQTLLVQRNGKQFRAGHYFCYPTVLFLLGERCFYTLSPRAVSCSIKINGSRAGSRFVLAFQAAPAVLGIRSTRIMPFNKQLIDQAGVKWTSGVLLKFLSSHRVIALYSCFAFVLWTINPLKGWPQQEGCAGVKGQWLSPLGPTGSFFSGFWDHRLLHQ